MSAAATSPRRRRARALHAGDDRRRAAVDRLEHAPQRVRVGDVLVEGEVDRRRASSRRPRRRRSSAPRRRARRRARRPTSTNASASSAIDAASNALRRSGRASVIRRTGRRARPAEVRHVAIESADAAGSLRRRPHAAARAAASTRTRFRPTSTSSRGRPRRDPRARNDGEGLLFSPRSAARRGLFVDAARGKLKVAVNAGAQTTADTVALAEHAAQDGADAVAVIAPPYFPLDDESVLRAPDAAARACAPCRSTCTSSRARAATRPAPRSSHASATRRRTSPA